MKKCSDDPAGNHPRSLNLQNSVVCVLYHLSFEDKVKSMFAYTDCIPLVMKMILETTDDQVSLEVMALGVNLAANKRNAQLICEGTSDFHEKFCEINFVKNFVKMILQVFYIDYFMFGKKFVKVNFLFLPDFECQPLFLRSRIKSLNAKGISLSRCFGHENDTKYFTT